MKRQLCVGLLALGFCGYATAQEVLEPVSEALTGTVDMVTLSGLAGPSTTAAAIAQAEPLPVLDELQPVLGQVPYLGDFTEGLFTALGNAPEDLGIIAGNLENVPAAAIDGREIRDVNGTLIAPQTGLRDGAVELLKGNLIDPAPPYGTLAPSATASPLLGLAAAADTLVSGSSHDRDYYPESFVPPFPGLDGLDLSNIIIYSAFYIERGTAGSAIWAVEETATPLLEGEEPLTPEDLNIIVGNLDNVPEAAIDGREIRNVYGTPVASETGLRDAAVELLKGNLVAPYPGYLEALGPSATSSALLSLAAGTDALIADTSHDRDFPGEQGLLPVALLVSVDVSNTILHGTLFLTNYLAAVEFAPVEEDMHPLFEGAEPLTLPVIDILEDL